MSKFWSAKGSSSESESQSDNDSVVETTNQKVASRFAAAFDSDSDSSDEVRVVKSQKDKSWDAMKDSIQKLRSAMRIDDWSVISDEFDNINKLVEKSKMLILKNGMPKFYIKILSDIETYLNESLKDKDLINNFKPMIKKSFNRMKTTIKKHNRTYEKEIADYLEHPENYADSEKEEKASSSSSSSDSDSDSDSNSDEDSSDDSDEDEDDDEKDDEDESEEEDLMQKPKPKTTVAKVDDSDEEWDQDSEEESSDDEPPADKDGTVLRGRAFWVKKVEVVKKKKDKSTKTPKVKADKTGNISLPKPTIKAPQWKVEEITEDALEKKLIELMANRGKKRSDNKLVLRQLEVLAKSSRAFGPKKEIVTLMHLISSVFDSHRIIDDFMDLQSWRDCHSFLSRVLAVLDENPKIILGLVNPEDTVVQSGDSLWVKGIESEDKNGDQVLKLVGSIESFAMRLQDEYTKGLQHINPHTQEYVIRLSDEANLLELLASAKNYYLRVNDVKAASNMALIQVEHLYYKHDTIALAVHKAHIFNKAWGKYSDLHPAATGKVIDLKNRNPQVIHPAAFNGAPAIPALNLNPSNVLNELTSFVFKYGDERAKTRALLCAVYHHSLHNRYYAARDLFLMSHIQDTIEKADTSTQILYNRALVTLGLSAFRLGLIQKAHDSLSGVCSGRVRELLAQGQSRWSDRDAEQENAERRRQMPYHMHINHDLLEACHLICAMLLELPIIAGLSSAPSQKYQFRKHLQTYNRQVFTGPPENTREHILASAKALLNGDWRKAVDYIINLEVWSLLPNDEGDSVKTMLRNKLKEEGLRIYLITSSVNYNSIHIENIAEMFDINSNMVKKILNKMLISNELSGTWNSLPEEVLIIHKIESSPLQSLSIQLAEKLQTVIENNEKILEPIMIPYSGKEEWGRNVDPRNKNTNNNNMNNAGNDRLNNTNKKNNNIWKSNGQMNAPNTRAYQSQSSSRTKQSANSGWGSRNPNGVVGNRPGISGNQSIAAKQRVKKSWAVPN